MAAKRITVVGSYNTDMIVQLRRIPRPGETLLGGEFRTARGGKGANQAVAAARAGGQVSFIARVGRDSWGDEAIADWVAGGIDVSHVIQDRLAPSGAAMIFVAHDGENSIGVAGGANARLSRADVARARRLIVDAGVLMVQLETPQTTVQAAVRLANDAGVRVILNPAPARELPDRLLRRVFTLTPNETEAELLTGIKVKDERSAAKAAAVLHARGAHTVIVTLGARGALLSDGGATERIPGFKVKPVDTTGAGDVFNGALAVALAEDRPLRAAVRFANAAAALSVTRWGAQPSAPNRREIEKFLKSRA